MLCNKCKVRQKGQKMLLNVLNDVFNLNVTINALLISIGKMIPLTMTALADEELEETPL